VLFHLAENPLLLLSFIKDLFK